MSLRIDIPVDTNTTPGTPPARLAEYNASPKTPEEYAAIITRRDERVE